MVANNYFSEILIHLLVVLLILAGSDVVHPFLVVEIPADGLFDTFFKLQARFPTKFSLELAAVDGVAHVVAGTDGGGCEELL